MTRSRLAMIGLTILLIGIGIIIITTLMGLQSLGPDLAIRSGAAMVGGAMCTVGVLTLLASGIWYANDRRIARGQQAQGHGLAERVESLLAGGTDRAAVQQQLLAEGMTSSAVDTVLELEWPHGQKCPKCEGEIRRFAFLLRHLQRSWYHCPRCAWVGQIGEDDRLW